VVVAAKQDFAREGREEKMKPLVIVAILLGEVMTANGTGTIDTRLTVRTDKGEIALINKKLNLKDFPCNPYPTMLFYYTESGYLRCGEPPE
jgi:hypothetical protein